MASSDNLTTILDPWAFRPSFQDPWISDVFSRETDALSNPIHSDLFSSFFDLIAPDSTPTPTPTGSGISADPEIPAPNRPISSIPPTGRKITKRKSRASKRNHTTFITADPANFRHMVQQVTGVRFGNSHLQIPPLLKPEPQRPAGRFTVCDADADADAGLPTLDTSAYLLNHHQQNSGSGSEITGPGFGLSNDALIGSDFDTFSSFPTLESWKAVM
ncbi:calmodulin-binding protein 25-like [Cucurbita moschata]|uniref:Calmodulin-binding protein 25-like n=1 Tax=Cucurbita moschata TaxID=3662 RepID=A0A6J1GXM6_CUCMO|nr:calmodulin-binding protein 25-like [Cucurbita moschata]